MSRVLVPKLGPAGSFRNTQDLPKPESQTHHWLSCDPASTPPVCTCFLLRKMGRMMATAFGSLLEVLVQFLALGGLGLLCCRVYNLVALKEQAFLKTSLVTASFLHLA